MYHLRLKGDHYQMGVKRGNIFQKAHISFPLQLDNFQLEHGKQSEEILRKFFPEICEEVRGVPAERCHWHRLSTLHFLDVVYGLLYV